MLLTAQVEKITMIALGVGNETYLDELQEIAPKDHNHNRLFTVSDFTQLQNVVQEISDLICKGWLGMNILSPDSLS